MVEVTPLRLNDVDITGTSLSKIGRAKAGETVARANLPPMVGATSVAAGQSGLAPAPQAGDEDRVLTGAGTYVDQTGGGAGGPSTPATTTTGFIPKWGDNVGDSLDAGVEAPSGPIAGTTDVQTFTNKSISGASNTVTALPTTALADGAVTYPKMQDVSATDRLLGRVSSGSGDVEEVVCTDLAQSLLDDATQGAMQSTLGVDPAGTDNSTPVSLAGTPDYITLAGQVLTRNAIDLATDVTGALPIANGGTGQTSQTAGMDALSPTTTKGDILIDNGTNVVRLPVGSTNGHVLTVDAAEATGTRWAAVAGGGDALTSDGLDQFDTTTSAEFASVISDPTGTGSVVLANAPTLVAPVLGVASATSVNKVAVTAPATGATLTIADGATLTASASATVSGTNTGDQTVSLTGDVTGSGTGSFAATIAADAVTNSKLANAAANSFKANLTGSAANPTDVALADLTEEASPAAGDFVLGMLDTGELRKYDVDNLPGGAGITTPGTTVNNRIATWVGTAGDELADSGTLVADLQAVSAKAAANGYAGLDALAMVPTAQLRPLEWDKIHYSFHATPGRGNFDVQGQADRPMMDGIATYAPATGGGWIQLDSVGGHAGIITSLDTIQTRWSPTIQFSIKTPTSLTGCRFWFGIFQAIPDSTAPVANGAAFAIKSAAVCWDATVHSGSNFWRSHTSDGTDATVVTGSVAIATSTDYKIRPVITPASISFYINDTLIGAAHTTDLPGAGDELGIGMRGIGTFFWKRIDVIHD